MAYFPASGHRAGDSSAGALGVISEVGHVWTASSLVGDYSAFLLRLSAEDVRPFFLWYRASGFPVRCVQELAGVLYQVSLKLGVLLNY
ncbi:hypothetical protein [Bacteroides sp.]